MLNYWKADAYRIVRSLSFWVLTLAAVVMYAAGIFILSGPSYSAGTHASVIIMIGVMASIFTGLGIYNTVYSQDIKAGAMRVAIGRGTGRTRVVIAKFLEMAVVAVIAGIVLYVVLLYFPAIFSIHVTSALSSTALTAVWQFVLETILFSALASIISMARQESVTATVVFVLLASGVVDQLLSLLLSIGFIKNMVGDITGYLPQSLAATIGAQFSGTGDGGFSYVAVYVGYIVVSLALSCWAFHRKELDF